MESNQFGESAVISLLLLYISRKSNLFINSLGNGAIRMTRGRSIGRVLLEWSLLPPPKRPYVRLGS